MSLNGLWLWTLRKCTRHLSCVSAAACWASSCTPWRRCCPSFCCARGAHTHQAESSRHNENLPSMSLGLVCLFLDDSVLTRPGRETLKWGVLVCMCVSISKAKINCMSMYYLQHSSCDSFSLKNFMVLSFLFIPIPLTTVTGLWQQHDLQKQQQKLSFPMMIFPRWEWFHVSLQVFGTFSLHVQKYRFVVIRPVTEIWNDGK